MDEPIAIEAKHLSEVLARLTDRRLAVEKELSALGEAKKGAQDIFRHCRGFERAYSVLLQEAATAFKIRAVVEGTLPESLHKIPIEKRFTKAYVREICRQADGFQPHLVSPERGIKRLVQEAMQQTSPHVHRFVDEIHLVLMETVREAARRSVLTEAGISSTDAGKGMDFLRLKGFENAVIQAASRALDEWKTEAHKVAETMVQMECDYVTPSFFRELEKEYQSGLASEDGALDGAVGEPEDRMAQLARGMPQQQQFGGDDSDDDSEAPDSAPVSARSAISRETSPQAKPPAQLRDDLKAGWLEKRSGDSSSLNALPVDSWKWQRRWFVLAMESGFIYYFKSPEQMSTPGVSPKVTINLRDCIVEDFDASTQPSQKRSTQRLDNRAGGTVSLLIRVSHKNPAMSVAKNHHQIILRADNAAEKFDWLAHLRNACDSRGGMGKAPPIARGSSQQLAAQQPAAAGAQAGPSAPRRSGTGGAEPPAPAPAPMPSAEKKVGMFGRAWDKVSDRFGGFGGSKLGSVMEVGSIEDLEVYYERLGTFTGLYARHIFNRMAKTVPKAIILCQVIRSRDRLLDQLYNYLMGLKPVEMDALLAEDPSVVKRRNAARQAARELSEAQAEVRTVQEVRADTASRTDPTSLVSLRALLLAGAYPLIPPDKVPSSVRPGALYGEFTPVTLLQGVGDAAGAAVQLGSAALKTVAGKLVGALTGGSSGSEASEAAAPAENGATPRAGGSGSRPGSAADAVAPSPTAAAASAAAKPRRQPPPPPPKM